MPKNILQDIVPPDKRSIRNIPLPQRKKPEQPVSSAPNPVVEQVPPLERKPIDVIPPKRQPPVEIHKDVYEPATVFPFHNDHGKGTSFGSKKALFGALFVAVIIMAIAVMSLFGGATITVTPAQATSVITPETKLSAEKNAPEGTLPFQIVTLSRTESKEVPATGEENVERKASGQIVIYNNFDSNDQRLIKNTRFETPEGLIYRINESVVVPGRKSENGSTVPGQVEVTVYADEAGDTYNIGKKDFTIPGFKGDPRFSEMYARSKSDMTGGFVGVEGRVSDDDRAGARAELQATLTEGLKNDVTVQIPDNFILFDDAFSVSFRELPQENKGNTVIINEEATLTGILFEESSFARSVADALELPVADYPLRIVNTSELSFVLEDKETFTELSEEINFTLDGAPNFISEFDTESLVSNLAGQPKKSLGDILTAYPQIEKAESVVRPFWKRTFPDNPEDITVKNAIDGE